MVHWLDEVIASVSRRGLVELKMDYWENRLPMALWMIEVVDAHVRARGDWWPDRQLSLDY